MSVIKRFRSIRTFEHHHVYLDVQLIFASKQPENENIEIREFKLIIMHAIDCLFGELGAKMLFDIIKYRGEDHRAFIRISARDHVKFRLCLTLLNEWKEMPCQFMIYKASHCLASLVVPSSSSIHLVNAKQE